MTLHAVSTRRAVSQTDHNWKMWCSLFIQNVYWILLSWHKTKTYSYHTMNFGFFSQQLTQKHTDICTSLWSPQVFLKPCHQYILGWCFIAYLFLLSFSFPCYLFSQNHKFSQNKIRQNPRICDLQGDTILWLKKLLLFQLFHHVMSSDPKLMPVETSWAFIFWYMGYHKPSRSLGTYLAHGMCVSNLALHFFMGCSPAKHPQPSG